MNFEEFKEEFKNEYLTEEELSEFEEDKSAYRNYKKDVVLILGYLMGVPHEHMEKIDGEENYNAVKEKLEKNEHAKAIRHMNNIRSNLMLLFKKVSRTIRLTAENYTPIYNMEEFKEDFQILTRLEVNLYTGRQDINEYLQKINDEISRRITFTKIFFPDWIEFRHIKLMFNMPSNIKAESEKFQSKQGLYPYRRYFNWKNPEDNGNILLSDLKMLNIIYENGGEYFMEVSKVMDASDKVKNNINDFISNGEKVQIFVDGENVDPYHFASAIDGLRDHEIEKINKIVVYYDSKFSSRAWIMLKHFIPEIEIEAVPVDRINTDKSLVDHKLVAGVSKAVYRDGVDSVIIASSDSDFWSVIEEIDEAKYLVMAETDKCGHDFKEVLREHNVFYCYLDKFITTKDNLFFRKVFCHELNKILTEQLTIKNAFEIIDDAIINSRAEVSDAEKSTLFEKYIKGLKLTIDKDGNFGIEIPE